MKPLVVVALLAALCSGAAPAAKRETAAPAAKRETAARDRREVIVPRQPEARVIAAKTRRVLAVETSAGPVALWAAPTRAGGQCWLLDIDSGAACSPAPALADFVIRPWQSETNVGGLTLRLLSARVTPEVASVTIRFADGTTDDVRPTGGFFVRELRGDDEPQLVIAHDEQGRELRRRPMPGPRSFRRELPFPTGDYRNVIALKTTTLAVAPGTNGTVCRRTVYRGSRSWGCGSGPSGLMPDELDVEVRKRLVVGSVGRAISRLEAWYAAGGGARIPVVRQYVLFEIPRGRVPRVLAGFGADGSLIARRRLD
jgi:hypothetical protein